jgi:hypothetical protein
MLSKSDHRFSHNQRRLAENRIEFQTIYTTTESSEIECILSSPL